MAIDRSSLPMSPLHMPATQKYARIIGETLAQLNHTNQMIEVVKKQVTEAEAAGNKELAVQNQMLAMHLDAKATNLLIVVATYEVALQQAIVNERVDNASRILKI